MNRATVAAFALALSGAAVAQYHPPMSAPPPQASIEAAKATDPAPTGSNADLPFYRDAIAGGVREIALSRLAMSQSSSAEVKMLAGTLANEHATLNSELKDAGKVTEPAPSAADNRMAADMRKMSGALFDRTWLATMERDHLAAIALFEDAALKAQNSTTRDLATTALASLRHHLLAVQDLQKKLMSP
jgi:putative membrane protein